MFAARFRTAAGLIDVPEAFFCKRVEELQI